MVINKNIKNIKKFSLMIFLFLFILFSLFFKEKRDNLEVDFFDVGQGDSILIKAPDGQNILIDGGPDNSVIHSLNSALSLFDNHIDLMILTHPHSDHVSGLNNVLDSFSVGKILYTGVTHTSPSYIRWLEKIKYNKIDFSIVDSGERIILGDNLYLEILYPNTDLRHEEIENLNNTSIVARLVYNNHSFLFTGDAEGVVEDYLLDNNIEIKSNVLKVAHHGSKTSSSEFFKKVNPEIAVIEVGEHNQFGHPAKEILDYLLDLNIKTYRTDIDGTIKIFSDGINRLWIEN